MTDDPPAERRKLATLLFCDVVGSTELGESSDPEAVRSLMSSYFDVCRTGIERHGGTVEKFIGDAVMAVFGVPVAHEEDPVRAVSAALAIREGVAGLEEEAVRRLGRALRVRIGVATGEVVAGDDASRMTMVTGDAVNTAARLEAAASPGEVLVDAVTAGLVAGAVECESAGGLTVKGKRDPVEAFRVVPAAPGGPPRRPRRPERSATLVGREAELAHLRGAFADVVAAGRGRMVTVVGDAGVGKSRLVAEAVTGMSSAQVVGATCPPYGEGMTYYPLRELLGGLGLDLDSEQEFARGVARRTGDDDPTSATTLAHAVGLADGVSTPADITSAWLRLLEGAAADGPVVVVVDDVQWAQPALVELLLAMPERQQGPVLLLCLARPELLELRPDWPHPVHLGALDATEVERLARDVLGAPLESGLREFIAIRSAGNPLFAQELAESLRAECLIGLEDGPRGVWWAPVRDLEEARFPTTLAGLLGARLDRTPPGQRRVMECGSIEGETFHAGAVARLAEAPDVVDPALIELHRQRVVVPETPVFPDETAYRFHHLLLRDAAYAALPKARRGRLHAGYAAWVADRAGHRLAEFEELVAHHLEQALMYRLATGGRSDQDREEETRLGRMQRRAGNRAADRADVAAAVSLLTRAARHLEGRGDEHVAALLDLGQAQWDAGQLAAAETTFDSAVAAPAGTLAAAVGHRAVIQRARIRFLTHPEGALDGAVGVLRTSAHGDLDDLTLAHRHALEAEVASWRSDHRQFDAAMEEAVASARRSGDDSLTARMLDMSLGYSWATRVEDLERRCVEAIEWARSRGLRRIVASSQLLQANLRALVGDERGSRHLYAEAVRQLEEMGAGLLICQACCYGLNAWLLGDLDEAERELQRAISGLETHGEQGMRPTVIAVRGHVLADLGRNREAYECSVVSERDGARDDVANTAEWKALRARVLAARGDTDSALRLAGEAMAHSSSDGGNTAILRLAIADAYLKAGDVTQAAAVTRSALEVFERLGAAVLVTRAKAQLAACSRPR